MDPYERHPIGDMSIDKLASLRLAPLAKELNKLTSDGCVSLWQCKDFETEYPYEPKNKTRWGEETLESVAIAPSGT